MTEYLKNEHHPPINKLNICRICGSESESGQELFECQSEIEKIAVQICAFISIKLENYSQYPNWICPGCHLQFETTNEFIELIRNGQTKLCANYGYPCMATKKRKQRRGKRITVSNDQPEIISSVGNHLPPGKRVSKKPKKLKDSMQGNELETLYNQIGFTRKKSSKSEIEPVAQIEDQDGVVIGEMLSTPEDPIARTRTRYQYQCELCKEVFNKELSFYNHLSEHTNMLFECRECGAIFQTMTLYNDHIMQTKHTGLSVIENPPEVQCDKDKATSQSEITQPKKFVCIQCPKSFNAIAAMQRHLKTHNESRPFQCDLCFKKFKRKGVLEIHKESHRKQFPFKCEKCSRRFAYKKSLESHLRFVHDGIKPFYCSICKKNFSQKSNLKEHRRIHTGERPFVCLKCGSAFKTSSQCRLHQKTHIVEIQNDDTDGVLQEEVVESLSKNIECQVCGKQFNQTSAMKKHLRIHTGEKPYSCHLCSKKFSDPSNFKKHKQGHIEGKKQRIRRTASLLKPNLTETLSATAETTDTNSHTERNPETGDIVPASDSFSMLADVDTSLIGVINEDDANLWSSDFMITDIPNDDNLIVQQQKQQEQLLNQLVCISYQDPLNPVNSKTTYYVVNQENDQLGEISTS